MHELALADSVVHAALDAAQKEKLATITKIAIKIGELQQIKVDVFRFALEEVMPLEEPRLAKTVFELTTEPAQFKCRVCSRSYTRGDAKGQVGERESEAIHFIPELAHAYLNCPDCGSVDFEVVSGRGLAVEYIEGE